MPELIGQSKRGRKKEGLRLEAATLAAQVTNEAGERQVTVQVAPPVLARRATKEFGPAVKAVAAQTITYKVPKGAAMVPLTLTDTKEIENVRETLRNGAKDAGLKGKVKVVSNGVKLDDGKTVVTVFHLEASGK